MDLASVWMARASVQKKIVIRLSGLGYPFEKIVIHLNGLGYPFEKIVICSNSLGYPFEKKLLSIQTAWAIRSKKKLQTVWATEAIYSKINFRPVSISKQFCR